MILNITGSDNQDLFRQSFNHYMSHNSTIDLTSKKDNIVRIMSFNVYLWMNAIHQYNFDNQVEVIVKLNPDVFILQEAVIDTSLLDDDHHITRFVDLGYSHYIYSNDTLLDKNSNSSHFPNGSNCSNIPNMSYGNILFSKIPFINHRIINTSIDNDNDNDEQYSCLYVELENNIHIFGTHLEVHDYTDSSRIQQLEKIYQVINTIDSPNIILLGDLNLLYQPQLTQIQWNYQVSQDKSRNILTHSNAYKTIINNQFIDSFDYLQKIPPPISCCYDRRVDYIFIKNNFSHMCDNTQIVNTNVSDHLPIYLDLILT